MQKSMLNARHGVPLRLRRLLQGPTPHPFCYASASSGRLTPRRHLSLGGTTQTQTQASESGTNTKSATPDNKATASTSKWTESLDRDKPAVGTLLRTLGDDVFDHGRWTSQTLWQRLERNPRLWARVRELELAGNKSESEGESQAQSISREIEPPARPRGWPTPVVSQEDVQHYFPYLYSRGWFVEHDTPVESGQRGVPALAKHFLRLTPDGGTTWDQQRNPNFRAVVQALERQEKVCAISVLYVVLFEILTRP